MRKFKKIKGTIYRVTPLYKYLWDFPGSYMQTFIANKNSNAANSAQFLLLSTEEQSSLSLSMCLFVGFCFKCLLFPWNFRVLWLYSLKGSVLLLKTRRFVCLIVWNCVLIVKKLVFWNYYGWNWLMSSVGK